MKVKGIKSEDFVNYKLPSLFISSCYCSWKCCIEQGYDIGVCQNSLLSKSEIIDISDEVIYRHYIDNPITKAVVIGGLEPMIQINEVIELIDYFRSNGEKCPFVIYTGYYEEEIKKELRELKKYKNIIIKFGRFIPNHKAHYDEVLGVFLASDNQYVRRIS